MKPTTKLETDLPFERVKELVRVSEMPIDQRRVDIWYVLTERISDPGMFDEYRRRLPPDEIQGEQRFAFEKSRIQYLIARILVRTVLSHYTGNEIGAWEFVRNKYGKPSVASPQGVPLEFNLSHTDGLTVCAVSRGHELGVDVEDLNRVADHLMLARRFFSTSEADALEGLPRESQRRAFLRFWTLKEAFIKARGMGLSIPLDSFAFSLSDERPPTISFSQSTEESPDDWQFAQIRLVDRYQIALAVRRPRPDELAVQVRETVPLGRLGERRRLPSLPSGEWLL